MTRWLHVDELDDRDDGTGAGTFSDDEARCPSYRDAEPADERGLLWSELTSDERAYLTRMGLR